MAGLLNVRSRAPGGRPPARTSRSRASMLRGRSGAGCQRAGRARAGPGPAAGPGAGSGAVPPQIAAGNLPPRRAPRRTQDGASRLPRSPPAVPAPRVTAPRHAARARAVRAGAVDDPGSLQLGRTGRAEHERVQALGNSGAAPGEAIGAPVQRREVVRGRDWLARVRLRLIRRHRRHHPHRRAEPHRLRLFGRAPPRVHPPAIEEDRDHLRPPRSASPALRQLTR
jgi:hypothetical protein